MWVLGGSELDFWVFGPKIVIFLASGARQRGFWLARGAPGGPGAGFEGPEHGFRGGDPPRDPYFYWGGAVRRAKIDAGGGPGTPFLGALEKGFEGPGHGFWGPRAARGTQKRVPATIS